MVRGTGEKKLRIFSGHSFHLVTLCVLCASFPMQDGKFMHVSLWFPEDPFLPPASGDFGRLVTSTRLDQE